MNKFSFELQFLAKKIRMKRFELNISQEKLSELIDCHPNALGRIERAQASPNFLTLIKIARALKIPPKDLMPD